MLVHKLMHLLASFLFALVLTILVFTMGPAIESRLWPVIEEVYVTIEDRNEQGISVLLSYTKNRDCEWQGVAWYLGQTRLTIDFRKEMGFFPRSRLIGDHLVGPWTLQGVNTLEGTHAEIYHKCHPFWYIHNKLYPPQSTWKRRAHVRLHNYPDSPL